jgi:hypothetical protein
MIFPANKKVSKNYFHNFLTFFPRGKKGMEMWQLVLIILALLLLFFIIAWYAGLNSEVGNLLDKLSNLL